MLKLQNLLDTLENTGVTSPAFVKAKMDIQDELHAQYQAETNPSIRHFFFEAHTTWRKLGARTGAGTLKAFTDAIYDLRSGLRLIESLKTKG